MSYRTNVGSVCFGDDNVGPFYGPYAEQLNARRGFGDDGFAADPQKVTFGVSAIHRIIIIFNNSSAIR